MLALFMIAVILGGTGLGVGAYSLMLVQTGALKGDDGDDGDDGTDGQDVLRNIYYCSSQSEIEAALDTIGIGDGNNDKPWLLMCGLKVTMGNAVPELKAIADYIAPGVENDGVADVIEKFVLSKD